MWSLAFASIRHHRRGFVGVFIAVLLATTLTTALGVLIESGLRGGVPVQRFSGAAVVVGAPQEQGVPDDIPQPLSERVLVSDDLVDAIAAVDGVEAAVGDVTVPLTTSEQVSVEAHRWNSAQLTPYAVSAGTAPAATDDVVVDDSFGLHPGDTVLLSHGGVAHDYTVSGTVSTSVSTHVPQVFLSEAEIAQLWPHAGSVAVIGVIADKGTDAGELATRISRQVPEVVTYTGAARGDVETVADFGSRSLLMTLSGSLTGVAAIIAMFVVSSTLSLSIAQRRRGFALLRAVGTSPRQVHGLVVREVTLVAGLAAVIGAVPGLALAGWLGSQFAVAGVLPTDFALAYSPLAPLSAIALILGTALAGAAITARRPAKIAPVDALREAGVESPTLGKGRIVTGLVLVGIGLAGSLLPLVLRGTAALAGPAAAALTLIIGAALLGPWIVTHTLTLLGPLLRRSGSASASLADANARGFTRRMATAVVPLALGISLAIVQLFVPATVASEAGRQVANGTTADYVVSAPASQISPQLLNEVAALPGVDAVTPVVHSTALVTTGDGEFSMVEPTPIQGINPAATSETLDLDVGEGSLADLAKDDTIAVSSSFGFGAGAGIGDRIELTLGDGTPFAATVVAVYERGLGFGDVTTAADALRPHTTNALDDYLLVSSDTNATEMQSAIAELGLSSEEPATLAAPGATEAATQSWVSIIALIVILGFVALSVVNTLVMATVERRNEFALLRQIGSTPAQIQRMTFIESLLVVGLAVVLGTAITLPPMIGIAMGISGQPIPTFQPVAYGIVAGATVLVGVLSIAVPTRSAVKAPLLG